MSDVPGGGGKSCSPATRKIRQITPKHILLDMGPQPGFAVLLWMEKCQMFQGVVKDLVYLQTFFYDYRSKSVLFALLSQNFIDPIFYMTVSLKV